MNIFQSISAIMSDVEAIAKDKRNAQQGFNFRGVDDVYNTLHPLLAKHQVFTVPEVLTERTEDRTTKSGGNLIYRVLTIRYRFFAVDGSFIDAVVVGEGMDSGDKASNKAMSIAHKYVFFQIFAIPTEDIVDPDATSPPASKPAKKSTAPTQTPTKQVGNIGQWRDAISRQAKKVGCKTPGDFYGAMHARFQDVLKFDSEGALVWDSLTVKTYNEAMQLFANEEWGKVLDDSTLKMISEIFDDDIPI